MFNEVLYVLTTILYEYGTKKSDVFYKTHKHSNFQEFS